MNLFTMYYDQFKENKREGRNHEQIEGTVFHNCNEGLGNALCGV